MISRAIYRFKLIIVKISPINRDYRDIRRLSFALLLHSTVDLITALFKLALQSHRSADYKAVLDDSSITVDTTSLDQHSNYSCW